MTTQYATRSTLTRAERLARIEAHGTYGPTPTQRRLLLGGQESADWDVCAKRGPVVGGHRWFCEQEPRDHEGMHEATLGDGRTIRWW